MARPACKACGRPGPTIGGRCPAHLTVATEIALHTLAAETVLADESVVS